METFKALFLVMWAVGGASPVLNATPASWRVDASGVALRACPSTACAPVGTAHHGGTLTQVLDDPAREVPPGWVHLDGDAYARTDLLVSPGDFTGMPEAEHFEHGRVTSARATVYAEPDATSRIVGHEGRGRVLALSPLPTADTGWYVRPRGGFISARDVRLLVPSTLQGEENPAGPIAFLIRALAQGPGRKQALARFARGTVIALHGQDVETTLGTLPRSAVRLFAPLKRPPSLPADARWVDVNLREEVLTAYEGDRPVFTTLVSTGKPGTRTTPGLFRITLKSLHDRMHGEGYEVEEVPDILYFHAGEGLHGAFWHNQFGRPITHGCVNLSPRDGRFLFQWAPPALPAGWHSLVPRPTDTALWVWVESKPAEPRIRPALEPVAPLASTP
jgi:hypothetical protein